MNPILPKPKIVSCVDCAAPIEVLRKHKATWHGRCYDCTRQRKAVREAARYAAKVGVRPPSTRPPKPKRHCLHCQRELVRTKGKYCHAPACRAVANHNRDYASRKIMEQREFSAAQTLRYLRLQVQLESEPRAWVRDEIREAMRAMVRKPK